MDFLKVAKQKLQVVMKNLEIDVRLAVMTELILQCLDHVKKELNENFIYYLFIFLL